MLLIFAAACNAAWFQGRGSLARGDAAARLPKQAPIAVGATIGVLGYTFRDEKGDAVLRAEYLYVDGKAYALRSSPA